MGNGRRLFDCRVGTRLVELHDERALERVWSEKFGWTELGWGVGRRKEVKGAGKKRRGEG